MYASLSSPNEVTVRVFMSRLSDIESTKLVSAVPSIVIAESLSCGKPVLITDKVNTSKTIKNIKREWCQKII